MMKAVNAVKRWQAWVWINALAALTSVSLYVGVSRSTQAVGFPLDDAWIHQTYARNLSDLGEWSFIPGIQSAGSTSPLWTMLLSFFHSVSENTPFGLTFLLGAVCLWALASLGELIFRRATNIRLRFPIAGLFLTFEWHLVWAGASGMETLLTAVIILAVFMLLQRGSARETVIAGVLIGIGVWVRPDAITLAGPLLFSIFTREGNWKDRLRVSLISIGAALIPFLGYLIFNFWLSGEAWPNTFYAKQAEYAAMGDVSIFLRYGRLLGLPLVGAGVLLVPGFLLKGIETIKRRNGFWIAMFLWWLGFTLIYALRLPVTYQHGRYLMPAMPVFFIIGLAGSVEWLGRQGAQSGLRWVLKKGWQISTAAVLLAFLGLGAGSYARDVAIINTEMVAAAKWLNTNTAQEDIIAVHDIGAVGYFSQRQIIDLAGLVTPEVIPIIRSEEYLKDFLDRGNADYLMTFPGWYESLTVGKPVVYQSAGKFSPEAGGENMTIYLWKGD